MFIWLFILYIHIKFAGSRICLARLHPPSPFILSLVLALIWDFFTSLFLLVLVLFCFFCSSIIAQIPERAEQDLALLPPLLSHQCLRRVIQESKLLLNPWGRTHVKCPYAHTDGIFGSNSKAFTSVRSLQVPMDQPCTAVHMIRSVVNSPANYIH